MCRRDQSSWWLLALFFLVFFFSARTVWGQETSEPGRTPNSQASASPMRFIETLLTDPWANFDSAWTSLRDELTASSEDSAKLSILLQGLQTEADGLRLSLALSIQQYEVSEASQMIERAAAEAKVTDAILRGIEAEKRARAWQTGAAILGAIVGVETVLIILSFIF